MESSVNHQPTKALSFSGVCYSSQHLILVSECFKVLVAWVVEKVEESRYTQNSTASHFTSKTIVLQVLSGSSRVGRITKQWSGLGKEYFTDADNFGISFPMDLDVNMKAVMLGAVFLIVSV